MITRYPYRTLGALLVAMIALFLLSASGHHGTYWSGGPAWLGDIGWFGFLLALLAFVVTGVAVVVVKLRERRGRIA